MEIYFNKEVEYSSFQNKYRTNFTRIKLNDIEQSINSPFTIPSGVGLKIYFDEAVDTLEHFFDSEADQNTKFLEKVNFTNFIFTNVKDLSYMFAGCLELKSLDLSNFNLTNITNMKNMFQRSLKLESVIFPENLQNLEDMSYNMFIKI